MLSSHLLMQSAGVLPGIHNGVCVARDDRKRHPQSRIVRLKQGRSPVQGGCILRAGPLLHRINRDLDREPGLEAGGHRLGPEHVPEHLGGKQMTSRLGHHGPSRVPNTRDREWSREGHVGAPSRVVVAGQKHQATQLTPAPDGKRKSHERAPGVTHDHGPLDVQSL